MQTKLKLLTACVVALLIGIGLCAGDHDQHALGGSMSGWGAVFVAAAVIGLLSILADILLEKFRR